MPLRGGLRVSSLSIDKGGYPTFFSSIDKRGYNVALEPLLGRLYLVTSSIDRLR
jgi:hypothetical protein